MRAFAKFAAEFLGRLTKQSLTKWALIAGVLVTTHLLSAKIGYDRLNGGVFPGLTIHSPLKEWVKATGDADAGVYLSVAMNFAKGKGLVQGPNQYYPSDHPYCFWGPGTPFALGEWLRLTHGQTVWSCFLFSALVQLIWGAVAVATAAVFTKRTSILVATAFLTGCCPPLHQYFYSGMLTCSEIVVLVPLGMMFLALSKASQQRSFGNPRFSSVAVWCTSAGVWLGIASLVRDSLSVFAVFAAIVLLLQTRFRNRRAVAIAMVSGCLFVSATEGVRLPVKLWNLSRINCATVATSSAGAVWRAGLWSKHDAQPWFVTTGIGMGEYLDPEAAQRVQSYYESKKPCPAFYSLWQLVQAVCRHPLNAMEFKFSRLPALWLCLPGWSLSEFNLSAAWCVGFYVLLLAYFVIQWRAGRPVPASLYLYPLFLGCSSALIHFEFRYTFPVWQMLVVLPAIWSATVPETEPALQTEEPLMRQGAADFSCAT